MKTIHTRNPISNHSSVFAYNIRCILRCGEDYRVGKGKLIGSAVCETLVEYPKGSCGWLVWIDVSLDLWSFASKRADITLLQIKLGQLVEMVG